MVHGSPAAGFSKISDQLLSQSVLPIHIFLLTIHRVENKVQILILRSVYSGMN
jgi:hypothetical protein